MTVEPGLIEATGVIIAGGESRRFGSDKALAPWRGGTLIEKIASDLEDLFSHTLLVCNHPEKYSFLGWNTVADIRPGKGPLAGLEAALSAAATRLVFLTGCDLPCLSHTLIRGLVSRSKGHLALIPSGERGSEPLCAVYQRDLLPAISGLLDQGELRISMIGSIAGVQVLTRNETRAMDPSPLIFANANRPEDLAALTKISTLAEKG